jgi:uncharacterized cupin superfamily protein
MSAKSEPARPTRLDRDPIHLSASGAAVRIDGFGFDPPSFEAYIAERCTDDDAGRLAMVEHSPEPWGMWECHTAGDEVVIVLSGVARFIQEVGGEQVETRVTAGEAIVNPAGVWHTADVEEPFSAVYLTPCPGTEHRPRD